MITGSVTPGIGNSPPSWPGCKEKLFIQLVESIEPKTKDKIEQQYKHAPKGLNEVLEAVNYLNDIFKKTLFSEKYVNNLKNHFEVKKHDHVYISELIEDFKFKAVKKIAALSVQEEVNISIMGELSSKFKNLSLELGDKNTNQSVANTSRVTTRMLELANPLPILYDIHKQVNDVLGDLGKCTGRVKDIVYTIWNKSVRIKDQFGDDFLVPELGHLLKLKESPAPPEDLKGDWNEIGSLDKNKWTTVISKKKFARLLSERKIFVLARHKDTGKRAICQAELPTYYFLEKVESMHVYRGMENHLPSTLYYIASMFFSNGARTTKNVII